MKRLPRLLTVPVLVVVLIAVMLGLSTPAGAWEEGYGTPDGWGTHDWLLKAGSDLAGGWVNMAIARAASDDPDTVYFDWLNHSYDQWGTVKKGTAPTAVHTHYDLAVGYLHAGNVDAASKEVGLMEHYYTDVWNPWHTNWDDTATQNLYHHAYELDVQNHEPSSTPTYSPVRVSDPYAATVAAATTSKDYYSKLANAYISGQGYAGDGVASTTNDLLARAAKGLADLIYSIKLDAQIFQQTDSNIVYTGTWTTSSATAASGGSFRFTNAAGSCTVSFNGSYLAWIAKKSPLYGVAKLTLDNVDQGTVDLYSATTVYGKVWETSNTLSSGTHTLKIEWTGTKNESATDYNISVDAFEIAGTIIPAPKLTRYQQTDSSLLYTGTWTTSSATAASGGSFRLTNKAGSCTVSFNGSYLAWLSKKSPQYGVARLTLDGVDQGTVDLYSATTVYGKVWETSNTLSSGAHTLTIAWTDTKNASATDYNISVDAFDVVGSLTPALTRYQQTDSRLLYAGTWTTSSTTSASGGSFRFTNAAGSCTVSFNGSYLAWIAKKSPVYGKATVTLDEKTTFTVDLYSASTLYQQKAWDTGLLAPGTHTVKIEWTGTKNSHATATNIGVDAIDVVGSLVEAEPAPPAEPVEPPASPVTARYEQDAGGLAYTGTWEVFTTTKASGGSYLRGRTSDASVTITFDGTYLAWIATAGTTLGKAYVSLDGEPETSVDLARSVAAYQQNVWDTGTLTPGVHTVTIRRDPTNAEAKYVSLDAVEIVGTLK